MSASACVMSEWHHLVYQFIRTYYSVSLKTLIMNKLNKPLYQYVMFFLFNYFTLIRCKYMYLDLNMVVSLCFFFVEHEIFVYFIVERNKKLTELKKKLLLRPFSCETIKMFLRNQILMPLNINKTMMFRSVMVLVFFFFINLSYKDFFMWWEELDFSWKLKKLLRNCNSLIAHLQI